MMMHDESSPPVRASLAPFGVEQEYESMRYLGVNFHILQLLPISFATQKKKKRKRKKRTHVASSNLRCGTSAKTGLKIIPFLI